MSETTGYTLIIENLRIEAGDSGWLSYDLRNQGENDIVDGELAVRYEALVDSDQRWVYDDVVAGLRSGEASSVTARLGENLADGEDYVVWVTILGDGGSPAWANVEATVAEGVFSGR